MSVDYSEILKRKFPNSKWKGSGATYNRIVWITPIISKADLDAQQTTVDFEVEYELAYKRMYEGYQSVVQMGFPSSALGTLHYYPATKENQVDLIGAVVAAQHDNDLSFPFPCVPDGQSNPIIGIHSDKEIADVLVDGAYYKLALFNKLEIQLVALSSMSIIDLKAATFNPA